MNWGELRDCLAAAEGRSVGERQLLSLSDRGMLATLSALAALARMSLAMSPPRAEWLQMGLIMRDRGVFELLGWTGCWNDYRDQRWSTMVLRDQIVRLQLRRGARGGRRAARWR